MDMHNECVKKVFISGFQGLFHSILWTNHKFYMHCNAHISIIYSKLDRKLCRTWCRKFKSNSNTIWWPDIIGTRLPFTECARKKMCRGKQSNKEPSYIWIDSGGFFGRKSAQPHSSCVSPFIAFTLEDLFLHTRSRSPSLFPPTSLAFFHVMNMNKVSIQFNSFFLF